MSVLEIVVRWIARWAVVGAISFIVVWMITLALKSC